MQPWYQQQPLGHAGGTQADGTPGPIGAGLAPPPTDAVLNRISQEFAYEELAAGTENFTTRLGEGTYGAVYRGTLRDATEVAIKALASPKEGGFREEVEVLSRFRHPNLVILLGFARRGRERYLVYELLDGGDLYGRVTKDAAFDYKKRLSVSLDAALGLSHLHGSRPQVFHRDVKTQNILIDRNGTGKVADFGLACLAEPNQRSKTVSQTSGTIGYADPQYIRSGVITEASEVYSMGMVLLEVLTGRPPALQHPNGRIDYQFEHLHGDVREAQVRLVPMVDQRGHWPLPIVERLGALALRAIGPQTQERPTFVDIVTNLRTWMRDQSLHQAAPQAAAGVQGRPAMARTDSPPMQVHQAANAAGAAGYAGAPRPAYQPMPQQPQRDAAAFQPMPQQPQRGAAGGQPSPDSPPYAAFNATADRQAAPAGRPMDPMSRYQQQREQLAQQQQQQQQQRAVGGHVDPRLGGGVPAMAAGKGGAPQGPAPYLVPGPRPGGGNHQSGPANPQPGPAETGSAERESQIQQVIELGFARDKAVEAFKRCSTVEAAVTYIIENGG